MRLKELEYSLLFLFFEHGYFCAQKFLELAPVALASLQKQEDSLQQLARRAREERII